MKDDDKALILLSSLLDGEYITLINGKSSISNNDLSAVLVNREVRRKDKASSSSSTTTETLAEEKLVPIIKGQGRRW